MTYDLAIPLPKICPREILLHMQISSKIFREALLAADNKTCRGINPFGEERINKALCDISHSN